MPASPDIRPNPALRAQLEAAAERLNAGDAATAERLCREILAAMPEQPWALDMLGLITHRAGDMAEAAGLFERAVAAAPDEPRLMVNLGVALLALKRPEDALVQLEKACKLAPRLADAWFNAGRALQDLKRHPAAIAAYGNAIVLAPNDVEALNNYGALLTESGRPAEALPPLTRAAELRPSYLQARLNLGDALAALAKVDEAIGSYRQVLARDPRHEAAQVKLAQQLRMVGRLDEALAEFRRATEINAQQAAAWGGLAITLGTLRRYAESEEAFCRTLALAPNPGTHSDFLVGLNYRADMTPAQILAAHRAWGEAYAAPWRTRWPAHDNDRDPDAGQPGHRRLKVGFVSPDFGQHPVGFMTIRMFEALDRDRFETVLYAAKQRDGPLAARFRAAAGQFVDAEIDDDALAARIRADKIDILIDLAGHFAANRLPVLARKPAPVQAHWAGYVASLGMDAVDWLIFDPRHLPEGVEDFMVERPLRLPDLGMAYDPPAYAPPVNDLPAAARGFVTFAAFHNPSKIGDGCAALWARVLASVPQSRIVLQYRGLDAPSTQAALRRIFAAHGVDGARLDFRPPSAHPELLARYGECDIALDSTPYCGATTTCEATWMGVPVVTLPAGPLPFGRHGLAFLTAFGMPELIARDEDDYVAIAVALARDTVRLAQLRATLRARMAASPACDAQRFVQHFADGLRTMWRDWVARVARS
jgi:predicted O-linked N-acetylglucosamine transferase (SPINDLY family)